MKHAGNALLALTLMLATAAQAAVTATVDRNQISINDSLVLTLRASEGEDVESTDLGVLRLDFDVVSTGRSTNLSFIDGRTERITDLRIVLLPRRMGDLTIPPLSVDGKRTREIRIQVSDTPVTADISQDVFVESEVDATEVYVQSQLLHTFRIYEAIELNDRGRSELKLEDAVVEELESNSFQRTINGRPYRVIEVRHAIFPQKSGELVIPAISFNGRKSSGRRSLLSFSTGEVLRRRSKPITVTVKRVPDAWPAAAPWVPASNLRIEESWSALPDELEVGDSVTRTLTLVAEGVDSSQLPQLPPADIDGIKAYLDQPRSENRAGNKGITGIGVNSTALLITNPGTFTLPAVKVPWWDTSTDSLRYAELPARTLAVAAPAGAPAPVAANPVTPPATMPAPTSATGRTSLWMWTTVSALLGWLGTTVWLGWRLRAPRIARSEQAATEEREAALFKACLAACNANQALAARTAIQHWAQRALDQRRLPSLAEIARRSDSAELSAALEALERSLYAVDATPWQGDALALALKACRKQLQRHDRSNTDPLPPLYSGQA